MAADGLTRKQAQFVREYLIDLNGAQAAIRTGYSARTAKEQASRLLTDAHVAEAVRGAMEERAQRTEITADRVLKELAKIGFTDLSEVVTWGNKEVAFGYDDDGNQLPMAQMQDAVMIRREMAPYVEAADSDALSESARAAVSEVALTKDGIRIKMHDKKGALETIGRHLGMFKDKIEHSGPDGGPIATTTIAARDRAKAIAALIAKQRG